MFYVQNISIYMNLEGYGGGGCTYSTVHFLFIIKRNGKKYKSITYTKIKFYIILISIFFPRVNNKKFRNRGTQRVTLLFFYEVSIVVLIDFIAILLPPGIFLIQIVNTNNTKMYLNSFNS